MSDETAEVAPKPRRPRQQRIPGTAPPKIAEIEDLAENYRALRDERMKVQDQELDFQQRLMACMKKHKLTAYEYDDFKVELTSSEKVKVRKSKEENGVD